MPASSSSKGSTLNLRIDSSLKQDFTAATKAQGRRSAEVIRSLMRRYVEEVRDRRFVSDARRQSRLLAGSKDEAEVMRWIQDVSAFESER